MGLRVASRWTTAAVTGVACWTWAIEPRAQQVFRTSTDVVTLSVTANENGKPIGGLEQADFRVFEDGRPQDVTLFARDPLPISLSIVLDSSVSMESRYGIAQEAIVGLIRRLSPQDAAQVATFSDGYEIRQAFTPDQALLERAIFNARTGGGTALYNAVYIALDELRRQIPANGSAPRRRALVLLSDGDDNASRLEHEDVLDRAKRTDATVFSIGLRGTDTYNSGGFREHEYVLRTLAQASGGRAFFVNEARDLPAIYHQIADELSTQYTIGYTSKNTARDGAWRTISVRVTRPNVVARTRTGYYAPAGARQ